MRSKFRVFAAVTVFAAGDGVSGAFDVGIIQ